jgi:protein-disulfide isomerase
MIVITSLSAQAEIILGNPNGDVTYDFIYDYQCAYCHKLWLSVKKLYKENKNVKVRMHPVVVVNEESKVQALALVYLATDKDKFEKLNDYLLSNKMMSTSSFNKKLGEYINIDENYERSIKSASVTEQLEEGMTILNKRNIESVPYSIITGKNGKSISILGSQSYNMLLTKLKKVSN